MKTIILSILVLFSTVVSASSFENFKGNVQKAVANYSKVDSYTSMNDQKEFIDGKLIVNNGIFFKYKKPHLIYMKKTKKPDKNSEVIYNKKLYGDKIQYHAGGLLGAVNLSLDPKGSLVKKDNRHEIYDAGVGFIISLLSKTVAHIESGKDGEIEAVGEKKLAGETLKMFTLTAKDKAFYSDKVEIGFRVKDSFPVFIAVYNSKGTLLEQYHFKNLDYSKKLSAEEFTKDYKEYNF